ncbi:MAG: aspartate/glutamate racemase family protein [Candidatus Methanofastidiosia archaeon]
MKILVINPNSDQEMTRKIQRTADTFASGHYEVTCVSTPGAPAFIETYEDQIKAAPGMINLVREHQECDAFVVACHCDPNLDVLKELTAKPVVGIGEASMKIASMLGHKFSVLAATEHSVPNKEVLILKYHLEKSLASIRVPVNEGTEEERYFKAAEKAVTEDMAEVIVLGCAGMTGLDKRLQEKLGVPVLDGVICALIIARGFVEYGVSHSTIRRYNPAP